jgi:hypothetical protein
VLEVAPHELGFLPQPACAKFDGAGHPRRPGQGNVGIGEMRIGPGSSPVTSSDAKSNGPGTAEQEE